MSAAESSRDLAPKVRPEHRALAAGATLFVFLLVAKASLFLWFLRAKGVNALADVPPGRMGFIFGADAALSMSVAMLFLALDWASRWPRWFRVPVGKVLPGLFYAAIIVFSVASWQTARIYQAPLDVQKLRDGDNLMVLRESVQVYIGILPPLLVVFGLGSYPLLRRAIAGRLARGRLAGSWVSWGVLTAVCFAWCCAQFNRLYRINTLGVKDNAVLFFIRHYEFPLSPGDIPKRIAELDGRIRGREAQIIEARSLAHPDEPLPRDFTWIPASGRDFNIIYIQVESASARHFNRQSAPCLSALADHGVSFTRHATAITETSRASYAIYYSDYMPELALMRIRPRALFDGRPMAQPAVAEVLHAAGYRTGLFHSGFLDYLDIRYMFQDKGFETIVAARDMMKAGAGLAGTSGVREERTVEEMIAWIKAHRGERFFVAYLTETPHHPYNTFIDDKPFKTGNKWMDDYRNSLYYTDHCAGRLIQFIKDEGLYEKTIFVVFGDHGETVASYPVGHGLNMSLEEARTPLIISNPALFPTPAESRLFTSHLDISPTVTRLVGLDPPPAWLGRNLLSQTIPARMQFVKAIHVGKHGILDNGLLYVYDEADCTSRLYDASGTDLVPLPPDDRRLDLVPAYHEQCDLFRAWNIQHHFKRALQ